MANVDCATTLFNDGTGLNLASTCPSVSIKRYAISGKFLGLIDDNPFILTTSSFQDHYGRLVNVNTISTIMFSHRPYVSLKWCDMFPASNGLRLK